MTRIDRAKILSTIGDSRLREVAAELDDEQLAALFMSDRGPFAPAADTLRELPELGADEERHFAVLCPPRRS